MCVFTAPIFSGFTSIATYLLTREIWSPGAGLIAAIFMAMILYYYKNVDKNVDKYLPKNLDFFYKNMYKKVL